MKNIKVDFWKNSGKWYTSEQYQVENIDNLIYELNTYPGMTATVHIIEDDGFLQPYRIFVR